ncbi:hypothetical protein Tco_1405816 [Tanacetum coccineum]
MMTKSKICYDHSSKQAIGFEKPFYLKKARESKPKLYDGNTILKMDTIVIPDSDETLELSEESRQIAFERTRSINLKKQDNSDMSCINRDRLQVFLINLLLSNFPLKIMIEKFRAQTKKNKSKKGIWKPTGKVVQIVHWYVGFRCSRAHDQDRSRSSPFSSVNLDAALHEILPVSISSGLVPNPPFINQFVPPRDLDWDLLFQPMFDESPNVDLQAPEVIAPISEAVTPVHAVSTGSPSSTTVDQDAPSPSHSPTTQETQTPILSHDVEEDNHDIEVAHMGNDPYFGIPIPEVTSDQSSSSDVIHIIVPPDHQVSEHNSKWTKDHPLENIIVEPKNYKEAVTQACLIEANAMSNFMEFEQSEDWELVSSPDKAFFVISLSGSHKDSSFALTAFADADHADCQDTRRSISGSIQLLGDKTLSWSFKGTEKRCDIQYGS